MQKIISIDEYLYEISEKDWLIFQNMIQSADYNDSEKFNEALEFIEKKYRPINILDGRYNYK